jgi:hypothetical protein
MTHLGRRGLLLLPLAAAACGRREVPPPPLRPLAYAHLTRLPLNVATVEVSPDAPVPPPGDIGAQLQPTPTEAVRQMGRDRLAAVGTTGQAVFAATIATIVRDRAGIACLVGCRLEILSPEGNRLGFVQAEARHTASGQDASRPRAADLLLRRAMDDLNVEFEFQLRRNLRDWLATVAPVAAPAPVLREDLQRDDAAPAAIPRPDETR